MKQLSIAAPRRSRVAPLLLLLALSGSAALATDPPPALSDEIAVTLVELPVEVWRGSTPVLGLTAADFEVLEKGKRRRLPIVAVEPIDLLAPPAGDSPQLSASPPAAARRHLVLLFDFALSRADRLRAAVAASRAALDGALHRSDLVAVGIYLPTGELSLLLNFTADRAAAVQALDALAALLEGKPLEAAPQADPLRVTGGNARSLLAQLWLTREQNFPTELLASLSYSREVQQGATREGLREGFLQANVLGHSGRILESDVQARRREHAMTMADTLQAFAESLRWVEGRKRMLLFSEGFGLGINTPSIGTTEDLGSGLHKHLEKTLATVRRSGWAVDAVDLAGLRGEAFASGGLFTLADLTGGSLVEGGGELGSNLQRAIAHSARGYLLTVQVDVAYDGAYHPLEVRAPGADRARLVHRGGFYAPLPFREQGEMQRLAQAALLLGGDEELDQLGVDWLVVPLHAGDDGVRLGVVVEIPGQALTMGAAARPSVEVYAYGFDASGNSADHFSRTVQLDREQSGARLDAGGLRVFGQLALPAGAQRVRLLVRDRNDGRVSVLTTNVHDLANVAETPGSLEAMFLPPPRDPWLVVAAASAFDLYGRRLLPAARARLGHGDQVDLLLLGSGFDAPGTTLRSRILGPDGRAVEGGAFEVMATTPGEAGAPDLVVARLHAGSLAPGDYLLETRLAGRAGPPRAASVRRFRVIGGD